VVPGQLRRRRRNELAEEAGCFWIYWTFGYPVGIVSLLLVGGVGSLFERDCSRPGECPGGTNIIDAIVATIRVLNGGPPQLLDLILTLVLVAVVGVLGCRYLTPMTLAAARVYEGIGRPLSNALDPRLRRRPPWRPVRVIVMLPFFVLWLVFAGAGVLAPWLIAFGVLLATP
jgi:hypothetical protein